jgi:hypothetical protein
MMRRKLSVVTIAAVLALILTACGGGGGGNRGLSLTIEAVTVTPEVAPDASSLETDLCEAVDTNPVELDFAASYCLGNFCTGETEDECNEIDVINGNDLSQYAQDGVPDCAWVDNACEPSR